MPRSAMYVLVAVGLISTIILAISRPSGLEKWHTEKLYSEFKQEDIGVRVRDLNDYLVLEQDLFEELNSKIYSDSQPDPTHRLERYNKGSIADPSTQKPNWNRSFILYSDSPKGGVLLLHGMSDSPYSLRSLAAELHRQGYHVIGLRLPGHGTIPSGLKYVHWQDMAATVKLAMHHLEAKLGSKPVHIMGYSTGASLAINHTLDQLKQNLRVPVSLVLISPAIRTHPVGALAGLKNFLSSFPGLDALAYLSLMDEFDPYKYNSFATNAAAQVHGITNHIYRRIQALSLTPTIDKFPPVLVFKSAVDSTVTTAAVVDDFLLSLPAERNALVLFDINRNQAIKSTLMVSDPAPLADRLSDDNLLPFSLTFVSNEHSDSQAVVARHRAAFSQVPGGVTSLGASWPQNVISLSHVALTFPDDDPLYGRNPPQNDDFIFLGDLAFRGERGLLRIPTDWLLRMRYNPFYNYLEQRTVTWVDVITRVEPPLNKNADN